MKSCKLLTGIFAAVLAVSFAGCKLDVVSTETSFAENAHNLEAAENGTLAYASNAFDISLSTTVFNKAAADTTVSITIESQFKLDQASLDAGINFYECVKNTVWLGAPIRQTLLTKTAIGYEEVVVTSTSGKPVTTKITYKVDSSAVTANCIGVLFDATVLKTKQGTAFFNGNGNSVAGEAVDSFVTYIGVTYKAGDANPPEETTDVTEFEALGIKFYATQVEDFAPLYTFDLGYDVRTIDEVTRIYFAEFGDLTDYSDAVGTMYDDTMLAYLNQCYIFQTRAWNAEAWTDTPLTFTYRTDETNPTDIYLNGLIADVPVPTAGTQWRVLFVSKPGIGNEKAAAYYGGHTPYITYRATEKKYVIGDMTNQDDMNVNGNYKETMSNYYEASPAFIAHLIDYNYSAADPKTFVKGNILNADIQNYQSEILNLISTPSATNKSWKMKPRKELAVLDGFLVLDKDGEIVDTKVTTSVDATDGKTVVIVEILDTTIDLAAREPKLYVGAGTTLKENKEYPTELAFGCMPVRSLDENNGYIEVQKWFRPGTPLAAGTQDLSLWLTDIGGQGNAIYDADNHKITFNALEACAGIVFPDFGADFTNIEKIIFKPYETDDWGTNTKVYICFKGYKTNGDEVSYVDWSSQVKNTSFELNVSSLTGSMTDLDSVANITQIALISDNQGSYDLSIGSIELVAK